MLSAEVVTSIAAHPRMTVEERFAANLARCRKQAQLSQEELALRAGLHRNAIGKLEQGVRVARIDTLIRLAGALSVTPAELLDGIEWIPDHSTVKPGQFQFSSQTPGTSRHEKRQ